MNKEIAVAFIGAGGIAGRHRQVFEQIDGIKMFGYASADGKHVEALDKNQNPLDWGEHVYAGNDGYKQLIEELKQEEYKAAFVCLPPSLHGPVEYALIENGIPFFVEKPTSDNLETSASIVKKVNEASHKTAVGYQWRAANHLLKVQEVLEPLDPANITSVSVVYNDNPVQYVNSWWFHTGQVKEQAPHVLDMAAYLLEKKLGKMAMSANIPPKKYEKLVSQLRPEIIKEDSSLENAKIAVQTSAELTFANAPHVKAVFEASCVHPGDREVWVDIGIGTDKLLRVTRQEMILWENGVEVERTPKDDAFVMNQTLAEDERFFQVVRGEEEEAFCPYDEAVASERLSNEIADKAQPVDAPLF